MSGGYFDYRNDSLCNEMFRYCAEPVYGMGEDNPKYVSARKAARSINPMGDKVLSELLYDMFCLLHSLDWTESGDNSDKSYLEDMNYFRQKWLKKAPEEFVKAQIESSINELREELYRSLALGETE